MVDQPHPPFLPQASSAQAQSIALLHLRRDSLIPVRLQNSTPRTHEETGFTEGHVLNTRFGSFPHSTLLNAPWGSQVRASQVDTGSRGQKKKAKQSAKGAQEKSSERAATLSQERNDNQHTTSTTPTSPHKRPASTLDSPASEPPVKKHQPLAAQQRQSPSAKQAQTGFAHLFPLTPESWTISLPHRTQVVYTPDYSYVIQRLRIRPGSRVIEAGAGSGSFTHAAARAVYNGRAGQNAGRVFSYEYHAPRAEQLAHEMREHNLDGLVQVANRDVFGRDGFTVYPADSPSQPESPHATAVFLDLPDPARALPHLSRRLPSSPSLNSSSSQPPSPLDPLRPVHICAFLPCIEQVIAFTTALRTHGWLEIQMSELMHRRLEVRRERVGLDLEGLRGVNATAANVEESVARLRDVQRRDKEFREISAAQEREAKGQGDGLDGGNGVGTGEAETERAPQETRAERLDRIKLEQRGTKAWKEGRLVCRTEPEVKSHTSYLVFAVLPREWSEEDERSAREASQKAGNSRAASKAKTLEPEDELGYDVQQPNGE